MPRKKTIDLNALHEEVLSTLSARQYTAQAFRDAEQDWKWAVQEHEDAVKAFDRAVDETKTAAT